MRLSIIVPVWNEARQLPQSLRPLQAARAQGHEVIVVDGGSEDDSARLAAPFADRALRAARGRAAQMNAGAAAASGEALLFLHADTCPPPGFERRIAAALEHAVWGFFAARLSGGHCLFRLIETGMNWRSRLSAIATGDQCLFVRRAQFAAMGGFAPIPLMEDVELCRRLRRVARPAIIRERAVTSSRRWEENGILRTVALMWWLRLLWCAGRDPARLARRYERGRCYERGRRDESGATRDRRDDRRDERRAA